MSVRLRRLQSEYERLHHVLDGHDRVRILDVVGRPPEQYVIEFRVRSLVEEGGQIVERETHRAEITLGPDYPKQMPRCVMLTPVFHPNIDHLAICTEDIGSAGQTLDQTVIFIAEMLAYQAYNLQSPRNGDAARWTREHAERLPLDTADLFPKTLMEFAAEVSSPSLSGSAEPVAPLSVPTCANCGDPVDSTPPCAAGHDTCRNCTFDCRNCGVVLCLSCSSRQCHICKELHCIDCALPCDRCDSWVCVAHMKEPCEACAAAPPERSRGAV